MAQNGHPDPLLASGPASTTSPDGEPRNTEVLEELRRILDSAEFAGSERGRTLLVYLVENALNGGLERLKELTIGIEIFGRDATYDTGQDAIVRVSANSVRKRLQAYYSRVSIGSSVRIALPPGTYVPDFLRPLEPTIPTPPPDAPAPTVARPDTARFSTWLLSIPLVLLAAACAVLTYQNSKLRAAVPAPVRLDVLPWSAFAGRTDTGIILTDANFTLHKVFIRREMSLAEYSSLDWLYELKAQAPARLPISGTTYTSVASAVTASKIATLLDRSGVTAFVRSARSMQVDDFKEDRPIVLLGSAPSNPWVELIENRLNFVINVNLARKMQVIVNRKPRQGEQAAYLPTAQYQSAGIAFAVIALVPNLARKGPILLIAGTNASATQAAGEFVTDLPRLRAELRGHGLLPGAKAQQMELLLRVECMNSGASRSDVIAYRVTP